MKLFSKSFLCVFWLLILMDCTLYAQVETMSLRAMITQRNPSPTKIYRITDEGKQGDWRYDANDTESEPNIGTVLEPSSRAFRGKYKRVFDYKEGVSIDWFMTSPTAPINEALQYALRTCDRVNFGPKTYQIESITLSPKQLINPKSVRLHFQNTVLQAKNSLNRVKVLQIEDIPFLALTGTITLDGNAKQVKITNPMSQGGEAFLHIIAPTDSPKSRLTIGTITFQNMPMCGINVFVKDELKDKGYDRITAKALREINGFNHLNIQQEGFAIWGVNIRGAHRAIVIDSLVTQQDNEPWGDAPTEKSFYTFTFENQVDPTVHQRKDSLYIKHLYARYPCSLILYTQAVNKVRIDDYVMEGALRKPNVADVLAYPTMLQKGISWIGSKHTWTSYKSPKSSFYVKNLLIKDTNSAFMNLTSLNDMTGLWLNKGISGAVFDKVETDVRLKFYGDGYYFNLPKVPDGRHRVGTFICRIPAKRNYVQPLNADLTINKLHIAKGAGVTFTMENAKIGAITQEEGTKAIFESRENKFKNAATRYNGFIVDACQATHILWKFNWYISQKKLTDSQAITAGERYEFCNFSGNNFVQTQTTIATSDATSVYMTTHRYENETTYRAPIEQFLQFVEFDWKNVKMKLADTSPNDLTRKYLRVGIQQGSLLLPKNEIKRKEGWKVKWQKNSFTNCIIEL